MAGSDGIWSEKVTSLLRRVSQRIIRDLRHDIRAGKRKGKDTIPSAVITFVEKWLGFWFAVIGSGLVIGSLGMALVSVAEWMGTVSLFATTAPWIINHVWIVGLLVVLTWGVLLFSLVLVSVARLALWSRDTFTAIWNRHTPPFKEASPDATTTPWPPTEEELDAARARMADFLGWGAIIFTTTLFLLLVVESIAKETLYSLLSSSQLTAIGNSLDVGIGVIDFRGILGVVAPSVNQPHLVLVILFIVLPGSVMAIGTRNFLFLTESHVREHINSVLEKGLIGWSTAYLLFLFLYSIGVCIQLLVHWG